MKTNVSIEVSESEQAGVFNVSARGAMQIAVLVETMRRENYEVLVSRPRVITHKEDGVEMEPFETLYLELPADMTGGVIQILANRKGVVEVMEPRGTMSYLEVTIPTRGLIGFEFELMNLTSGHGVISHLFKDYRPVAGRIRTRIQGTLVSMATGTAMAYSLESLEDRGRLFVGPTEEIYEGQIVGESARAGDLPVNPTKAKNLTNHRSANKTIDEGLKPPIKMSLERAIEYIEPDEFVEVTPSIIRLRKRILCPHERKRNDKAVAAAEGDRGILGRIAQPRPQPLFAGRKRHVLAGCIIFHLVFLKVGDGEVAALRVREVKSAYRCRRVHGLGFGEVHCGGFARAEEIEEKGFLGVVRLGRVSRSGPDALVVFVDEFLGAELIGALKAPPNASAVVEELRKGFHATIGERLYHDRLVGIVLLFLNLLRPLVRAMNPDHKATDKVCLAFCRCYKVAQRVVGFAAGLGELLAQGVKAALFTVAGGVAPDDDVVAIGIGGKEPVDSPGGEAVLGDDLFQDILRFLVELGGLKGTCLISGLERFASGIPDSASSQA